MSRKRVLLFGAVLVVGLTAAFFLLTPTPPVPEPPPPPPRVEAPKPPLQADAEGSYLPGYQFTINGYRFTGFSLHPDAIVTFASTSVATASPAACLEARVTATTVHLRCDYPQVGAVTIDGRFLTRVATTQLDASVISAVVTVRSGSGEVLYNARDSFVWHPGE
jgi:hypothetical protein